MNSKSNKNTPKKGKNPKFINFSAEVGLGLPAPAGHMVSSGTKPFLSFTGTGNAFWGYNLFPQNLTQIAYESPTHGAALDRKAFMINGFGVEKEGLPQDVLDILSEVNEDGESFDDIYEKIAYDVAFYEGFALKVHYNRDGSIYQIHHLPFQHCRLGMPDANTKKIEYIVYSNNFDGKIGGLQEVAYSLPIFNPKIFEFGDEQQKLENGEQILYVQRYKPSVGGGMEFYSIPSYLCGLDAALTERQIGVFNKAALDNSFGNKIIIELPIMPPTDEETQEIYNSIKSNFTNAKNNGGFILSFANGGSEENRMKIHEINQQNADSFLNVDANVKQSIITAHKIPSILLEYSQGGGFNNRADEMKVAFEQYQSSVIASFQSFILKKLSRIFGLMGIEESITIKPFTLASTAVSDTNIQSNNV